ncbi:TPA: DUF551 domain-containing protein [Yersinia enterocolitica]|nr:DUF551 domain-containing protein [Yersinia enterocolitica]
MKELYNFTVERLEEITELKALSFPPSHAESAALARIALTAKRAEPIGYWNDACDLDDGAFSYANDAGCTRPLYTTPQLNSQVPLGSWINCSDQMPENDEFVLIWPLPDFGVELHVGQYIKLHKNGPGWFAQVYEHNYGIEFYPITVTHWMPLQTAPEKENG